MFLIYKCEKHNYFHEKFGIEADRKLFYFLDYSQGKDLENITDTL